jgi:hypothetical protein
VVHRISPDYHHTTDTAENNYTKMAKILRLAYLSGYTLQTNPHCRNLSPIECSSALIVWRLTETRLIPVRHKCLML